MKQTAEQVLQSKPQVTDKKGVNMYIRVDYAKVAMEEYASIQVEEYKERVIREIAKQGEKFEDLNHRAIALGIMLHIKSKL